MHTTPPSPTTSRNNPHDNLYVSDLSKPATDYTQLRGVTAIAGGLSAFCTVGWAHLQTLSMLLQQAQAGSPLTATVSLAPKLIALLFSMVAVSGAIAYLRTGRKTLALLVRVGLFWAIAAVLLCFVDMRWVLG